MVAVNVPSCLTAKPIMVILPRSAKIVPILVAVPPPSTSTKKPAGSLLSCKYTFLPAAKMVWPSGVLITPLFSTLSANSNTLPPLAALITAPFSTVILLLSAPTNLNAGLKSEPG